MRRNYMPVLVAALCWAACGEGEVAERAISFGFAVEAAEEGGVFTTDSGWEVELDEARVFVGALQMYGNPPPSAWRFPRLVRRAWAHAGFDRFDGGTLRGEWLGQAAVDLLPPGPHDIATLRGIAGPVRSANLELPPAPAGEGKLAGFHAWVSGTARRGEESLRFAGGLDLPDQGPMSRRVAGIPVDFDVDDHAEVVLRVHLRRWFDDADFATLPDPVVDEVRPIESDSQVARAWRLGIRSFGAFSLHCNGCFP